MSEVLRGLTFTGGDQAATNAAAEAPFSVTERTDLAVAAFGSLGQIDKAQLTEEVGMHMQQLHEGLHGQYDKNDVEPFMSINLSDSFPLAALVVAFDRQQQAKTYVYEPFWSQYSPAELNSRSLDSASARQDITASARAMLTATDYEGESGLRFPSKKGKDQSNLAQDHELVNPADYIILNAQRREAGEPLLDTRTFTRFVQLAMKPAGGADGSTWIPDAGSGRGQLSLRGGSCDHAIPHAGVRLSVGRNQA